MTENSQVTYNNSLLRISHIWIYNNILSNGYIQMFYCKTMWIIINVENDNILTSTIYVHDYQQWQWWFIANFLYIILLMILENLEFLGTTEITLDHLHPKCETIMMVTYS